MLRIWRLTVCAVAGLTMYVASPAKAIPVTSTETFNFTGVCNDCPPVNGKPDIVDAQLTLINYVQGTGLTKNDFDSFTYGGSDKTPGFTIDSVTNLSGTIPLDLPAFAEVSILTSVPEDDFFTGVAGNWNLGAVDEGNMGTWSVPEPASAALVIIGLVGCGWMRRRRPQRT
jgi:hypothetical protein